MKTILGNYTGQGSRNFPADCELFSGIQQNMAILAVIGNIAGDKAILKGCVLEQNKTRRGEGFVFLQTKDFPNGEVLYWEGGTITSGMYLKLENVAITVETQNYPQAYTQRSLAVGVGSENFEWSDFHAPMNIKELEQLVTTHSRAIELLSPPPLGLVQIWSGEVTAATIPEGYKLCDGSLLLQSEYTALFAVIGMLHTPVGTQEGTFCLPDLRGRFVVGHNRGDTDYNTIAKSGGKKTHTLTIGEMPIHNHAQNLHEQGNGRWKGGGADMSPEAVSQHDQLSKDGNTENTGSGQPHENRPPYYTLAYIMRTN